MPLFVVFGMDHRPHSMERRLTHRDAHRAYVVQNDAPIAFVGVCLDDDDNQCGSLYIFEAESEQLVRDWLAQDSFASNDVYERIVIRRFMLGVNRLPAQDWANPGAR